MGGGCGLSACDSDVAVYSLSLSVSLSGKIQLSVAKRAVRVLCSLPLSFCLLILSVCFRLSGLFSPYSFVLLEFAPEPS